MIYKASINESIKKSTQNNENTYTQSVITENILLDITDGIIKIS